MLVMSVIHHISGHRARSGRLLVVTLARPALLDSNNKLVSLSLMTITATAHRPYNKLIGQQSSHFPVTRAINDPALVRKHLGIHHLPLSASEWIPAIGLMRKRVRERKRVLSKKALRAGKEGRGICGQDKLYCLPAMFDNLFKSVWYLCVSV